MGMSSHLLPAAGRRVGGCASAGAIVTPRFIIARELRNSNSISGAKKAEELRVKFEMPESVWDVKWKQISSEHDADGARDQLRSGWNAWLAQNANDHSCDTGPEAAEVPSMEH